MLTQHLLLLRLESRPGEEKPSRSLRRLGSRRSQGGPSLRRTIRTQSRVRSRRQARRHPRGLQIKRWAPPPIPQHPTHLPTPAHRTPQTTSNHTLKHKARITHTHTEPRVPLRFTDRMITLELTWFSSKEKPVDWILSPLKKQTPTYRRVGKHSADPTSLVCSQNNHGFSRSLSSEFIAPPPPAGSPVGWGR